MPKLVLDNFLGGLSVSDRLGKEGSYYVGKAVFPLNLDYKGYLAPGPSPTTLTNTVSRISSMEVDSGSVTNQLRLYAIERDDKIHQIDPVFLHWTNGTEYPHTISSTAHGANHAPVKGEDVKIYPVGSTHYLFYSWNDNTDGDVGRVELSGTLNFDDDFMSSEPAGASLLSKSYPHPMLEWGESGYLYIADGRNLHQFDGQTGANGTFTANKFQLPVGWTITSLFDAGDYIGITALYIPNTSWSWPSYLSKARAAVFFWDGTTSQFNKRVYIEDPQIRASVSLGGDFYIFGTSLDGYGTIRQWDGSSFRLVQIIRSNGADYPNRTVKGYGDVDAWRNSLIFGSHNGSVGRGEIFLYGSTEPGLPKGLFHFANGPNNSSASIYAVKAVADRIFFNNYSHSAAKYGLSHLYVNAANNPNFLYKSLYYEFPQKVRINYIVAYFTTLSSGQGDDISIETDYGKETIKIGDISYEKDGAINTKRMSGKNTNCRAFRLIVQPDEGAGVKYSKFIVDYDFVPDN